MPIPRSFRRTRFLLRAAALTTVAVCTALPAFAQAIGCAPIFAAQTKLLDTPHHSVSVDSAGTDKTLHGGTPMRSESVMTGGTIYVQYKGTWRKSPMTVAAMKQQEAENIKNAKSTCAFLRNETVNGESTALYSIHSVTENATSDGQEWISKSRGLPLRTAVTVDVGVGTAGKSRTITNYDYSNVRAPAGVK